MINPSVLKEVATWIAEHFGKEIIVLGTDKLKRQWARMFDSRPILFLGPKNSGKSSLIAFLHTGKPYEVDNDGSVHTFDPTLIAAIVDKKVSLQQKKWLHIRQDLPGDEQLRAAWKQSVIDFHPLGIIYIINGNKESKIAGDVREACQQVFDICYPEGPKELCALHIFLSFSDQWGHTSAAIRSRQHAARNTLEEELDARPEFACVHTNVSVIHLSPHAGEWKEATRAVEHFGADLSK